MNNEYRRDGPLGFTDETIKWWTAKITSERYDRTLRMLPTRPVSNQLSHKTLRFYPKFYDKKFA